jgi:hypothetical protein
MPWRVTSPMYERQQFVLDAEHTPAAFAELCRTMCQPLPSHSPRISSWEPWTGSCRHPRTRLAGPRLFWLRLGIQYGAKERRPSHLRVSAAIRKDPAAPLVVVQRGSRVLLEVALGD